MQNINPIISMQKLHQKIKTLILLFICYLSLQSCVDQQSKNHTFYNASFEVTYPETEIPMQWYSGSEFGFFFSTDSSQHTLGKKSLMVRSTQQMQRWGAMSFLRMMDYEFAEPIRSISIEMDIKSDSVSEGYFSPFIWKQNKSGEILVKNLATDSLKGDLDWSRYRVTDSIGEEIDQNKEIMFKYSLTERCLRIKVSIQKNQVKKIVHLLKNIQPLFIILTLMPR